MRVSDIMTEAAVTDRADESLGQAAKRMWEQQTGSILLVDGDRLLGILTERDVLRAVAEGLELSTPVSEVMSKDLVTVDPSTTLRDAARIMSDRWIRHLPVIDHDRLVGVVSQRDLAAVLAGALNEPEALEQLIESSALARDRRLERIEAGTWD
ncbi:MAG: CBS domain-containing protein [Actinomycetota bacterium]